MTDMRITEKVLDALTGEYYEREIDISGVMTEEEGILEEQRLARLACNEEIKRQLAEADVRIIRAIIENDVARISAHKESQDRLRSQLT